jgi:hypothetical protein
VTFTTSDRRQFTGRLNVQNLVERTDTALANSVMDDMLMTATFAECDS